MLSNGSQNLEIKTFSKSQPSFYSLNHQGPWLPTANMPGQGRILVLQDRRGVHFRLRGGDHVGSVEGRVRRQEGRLQHQEHPQVGRQDHQDQPVPLHDGGKLTSNL